MNRRYFFKAGIIVAGLSGALPGMLSRLLGKDDIPVVIMRDGKTARNAELRIVNGIHYIPVAGLADFLGSTTYLNAEKKKFVFRFREQRVIVTVDNVFVLINSIPYQMPVPVREFDDKIYIPVAFLAALINDFCPVNLAYSPRKRELTLKLTDVNITGIEIEQRMNGTLIHIPATQPFLKKGLSSDIRNGWLAVDIYGGKIDVESIKRTPVSGIISKIDAFQFKESCSIHFKLKKKIVYRDVKQDDQSNEILVSIRTEEDLKHKVDESTQNSLEEQKKRWFIDTIIIDPGHGGKDPGAVSPYGKYYEKTAVLSIGLYLRDLLKQNLPGVKVIMTRDKDFFVPLAERTHLANRNRGKLFISIHANSNEKRSLGGFETYILGEAKGEEAADVVLKENSVIQFEDQSVKKKYGGINVILATMAQSAFLKQSQYLAAIVQDELDARLSAYRMKNRGVKQGGFWVMIGASMPNILVEAGFISNKKEYKLLKKKSVQKQIAAAIFAGVDKYKEDIERTI